MPIFDRYIAVDWSANNGPKTGRDSIWIGEATASGLLPSRNPATRALAMADIAATLLAARSRGERVMVGFDFVFGFPAGAAEAIARVVPDLSVVLPSPLRGGIEGGGREVATDGPPPPTPPLKGEGSDRPALEASDTSPLVGRAGEGEATAPDLSVGTPSPLWGGGTTRSVVGGGEASWRRLWSTLFDLIVDSPENRSNRFDVAAALNRATAPRFWGHPHGRSIPGLAPTRANTDYTLIAERRAVESRIRGPQPVWKLTGVGAVGSQTLLGIPRLEALRRHPTLGRGIAVWPFETDFSARLAPITLVEIYPSLFPPAVAAEPKDRAQVETCVLRYATLDAAGLLSTFLSAPAGLSPDDRAIAIAEEGWIAGVGHEHLRLALPVAA